MIDLKAYADGIEKRLTPEERKRFFDLCAEQNQLLHAIQSGVAIEHQNGSTDGSPKHLRVGVNMALAQLGALQYLLVTKGVATETECAEAINAFLRQEIEMYEQRINEQLGAGNKIKLG